jgi:hypothetical protein
MAASIILLIQKVGILLVQKRLVQNCCALSILIYSYHVNFLHFLMRLKFEKKSISLLSMMSFVKCLNFSSIFLGNLGRVDLISEFEYDLFIRPDTCNPRLRMWFNFTVDNVRADQVSESLDYIFHFFENFCDYINLSWR